MVSKQDTQLNIKEIEKDITTLSAAEFKAKYHDKISGLDTLSEQELKRRISNVIYNIALK